MDDAGAVVGVGSGAAPALGLAFLGERHGEVVGLDGACTDAGWDRGEVLGGADVVGGFVEYVGDVGGRTVVGQQRTSATVGW